MSWAEVIVDLEGNAAAPALPGHNSPALLGFDAYVDWLLAQAAALPRPLHVVGYSAGGRLVAGALARGLACDAATLISASFGLGSEQERAERAEADAAWSKLLRERGIGPFVDKWETQAVFASQQFLPAAKRARQRAERESLDAHALADAMDALSLGRMPDLRQAMKDVRVPWQYVVGKADEKFMALAKTLGAPHLVELGLCGHNPLLEMPETLALVLNEFVQGLA